MQVVVHELVLCLSDVESKEYLKEDALVLLQSSGLDIAQSEISALKNVVHVLAISFRFEPVDKPNKAVESAHCHIVLRKKQIQKNSRYKPNVTRVVVLPVLQLVQLLKYKQLSVRFVGNVVRTLDDLLLDGKLLSGPRRRERSSGKEYSRMLATVLLFVCELKALPLENPITLLFG